MAATRWPRRESHLQVLKTQLVEAIERLEADHGSPFPESLVLPSSPDDLEEIQMLLEDLYPKSNYRAEVVLNPATVVIKRG